MVKRTICRSPQLTLCIALSCLGLCPVNSGLFGLPGLSLPLFSSGSPLGSILVPLPTLWSGNSRDKSWGTCRTYFIYFPSLKDYCLSLTDAQCLINHCLTVCRLLLFQAGGCLLLCLGSQIAFLYVWVYLHLWGTIIIITTSAISVVDLNLCW